MTDTTSLQVDVYHCPFGQLAAVALTLQQFGETAIGDTGSRFKGEVSRGESEGIALRLRERAPGASWVMRQDPVADELGVLHAYRPRSGLYTAACDARGNILMTQSDLDQWLAKQAGIAPADTPAGELWPCLHDSLSVLLGRPWLDDWERALHAAGEMAGAR